MTQLLHARQALADPDRPVDFRLANDASAAIETVDPIESALTLLTRHPLVGRPVEHGLRELVISRGETGYLALYRYYEAADQVVILAVKHQREAGYT